MHGTPWLGATLGAVGLLSSAAGAQRAPLPSADSIIARNVLARGGASALAAVHTVRLYGSISFGGAAEEFRVELARPDRIRTQIGAPTPRIVQAYDGTTGWMIDPDHATPVRLPDEVTRNVAAGGDIDGPLVNYAAKRNHIEGVTPDTAQGRPAYRVAVRTAAGLDDAYYIDAESWLQTKWEGKRTVGGRPVTYESVFRDYQPAGGALFAHEIDSDTRGESGGQQIRLDSVRVNLPVSDSDFSPPTPLTATRPSRPIAHGTILTDSLASNALGVTKRFVVYLPPSYSHDRTRRYPVAYYLHGSGGDERSWILGLALSATLDSLAAAGVPEMIVVMPDGDLGFYHDWVASPDYRACLHSATPTGEPPVTYCVRQRRYGEYVAHDLVTRVDTAYRTLADAHHRGVAGLSMGGYGAVYLPLAYPDVFGAGASLSGAGLALLRIGGYPDSTPVREARTIDDLHAVWMSTWDEITAELGTDFSNWRAHDPVSLVRDAVAAHRRLPALWLAVGTEDESSLTVTRLLHQTLVSLGVPHEYVEGPGGHTLAFWMEHEGDSAAWLARTMMHGAPRQE